MAVSWVERVPWLGDRIRQRREAEEEIDRRFDLYCETINGIRSDHGLDTLALDLAHLRVAGRAVTEKIDDDQSRDSRP